MTEHNLLFKQTLHTGLTQKMQQAIHFLQLSHQELEGIIRTYLDSNPLLEEGAPALDFEEDTSFEAQDWEEAEAENTLFEARHNDDPLYRVSLDESISPSEYQDCAHSHDSLPFQGGGSSFLEGGDPFHKASTYGQDLRSHLLQHIACICDISEKSLAEQLVDLLGEDGILVQNWESLVQLCPYSEKFLTQLLEKLQKQCEPCGVFAYNTSHSLLLQLREQGASTPLLERIMDLLPRYTGTPCDFAKTLGIDSDVFEKCMHTIQKLNPRPASSFASMHPTAIVPDVLMHRTSPHQWSVELNAHTLPRVYINSAYYVELGHALKTRQDRVFLKEKYTEAKWLLKSLHQRAINLLKVTECIITKQTLFFQSGGVHMHPLTMKDVASEVGVSESTVSRLTTGKYIQTPLGTFELKHFFSKGVCALSSVDAIHSAHSIQGALQRLIEKENAHHPLSDQELTEALRLRGMAVARRTVAKYRTMMGIGNASDRLKAYAWQKTSKNQKERSNVIAFPS